MTRPELAGFSTGDLSINNLMPALPPQDGVTPRSILTILDRESVPERIQISSVRRVDQKDYLYMLHFASDKETRGHLDPPPRVPADWNDPRELAQSVAAIGEYFLNVGVDRKAEPHKILPLVAEDQVGVPVGFVTIRWRGDKTQEGRIHPDGRVTSIERLVIDPDPRIRHQGIGTTLAASAVEYAITKGYTGKGASQVIAWIMSDEFATDWRTKNLEFFLKLGFLPSGIAKSMTEEQYQSRRDTVVRLMRQGIFTVISGETLWSSYKERYGIKSDDREAIRLRLFPEEWKWAKEKNPKLAPMPITLRA